jgi:thiamine biosynthesis lipoprotein
VTALAIESGRRGAVCLALEAMATRFELVLHGGDAERLRAAGEEALGEIARLDRQLSFYRPSSDITWINASAADGPVRVEPGLFALLERCTALSAATDGAFDVTVAPLMRAWGFVGRGGALPDEPVLDDALGRVGSRGLLLDRAASSVEFARPGMSIDLGAAGKGYAVDGAMRILRDHGVGSALLHGGTSSIHAVGARPDGSPWPVAWAGARGEPPREPRTFALRNSSLSASAVTGKSFVAGGREYGHVIDPRSGRAMTGARAAVVTGPGSLECDALSTALLVLGASWLPTLRARFPAYDGAVA